MKFEKLDKKMRAYEQLLDQIIDPDVYIVARIDGKNFSRLTKEIYDFEVPFDVKFRDMMVNTTIELMNCGFKVIYGYTESDEISLLFSLDEDAYGRKVRKYNSILAGVASAAFSLQLGHTAVFDCRILPLPSIGEIRDYFAWRQKDANRNSLNAHCYWTLRKQGETLQKATEDLKTKSVSYKKELLLSKGVDYDLLPYWQTRGIGIWKEQFIKDGYNPITKEIEKAVRTRTHVEYELPFGKEYEDMIERKVNAIMNKEQQL